MLNIRPIVEFAHSTETENGKTAFSMANTKRRCFISELFNSVVFQSMQEDCCSFVSCLSVTLPEYKRSYKTLHIRDYVTTFLQRLPQLSGLKDGRKNGRVLISQQKAHWPRYFNCFPCQVFDFLFFYLSLF